MANSGFYFRAFMQRMRAGNWLPRNAIDDALKSWTVRKDAPDPKNPEAIMRWWVNEVMEPGERGENETLKLPIKMMQNKS